MISFLFRNEIAFKRLLKLDILSIFLQSWLFSNARWEAPQWRTFLKVRTQNHLSLLIYTILTRIHSFISVLNSTEVIPVLPIRCIDLYPSNPLCIDVLYAPNSKQLFFYLSIFMTFKWCWCFISHNSQTNNHSNAARITSSSSSVG
jgi:hypothetical protein